MSKEPVDGADRRSSDGTPSPEAQTLERVTAEEIIGALDLIPHREGGFFRETYRAEQKIATANGERSVSTSALYLLTEAEPSRFHRLRSDELWFYHSGALTELILMRSVSEAQTASRASQERLPEQRIIGPGSPCELVPAGWWVAARAVVGEQADWGAGRAPERRWTPDRRTGSTVDWSLVSCVVTPGFEYEDFEMGDREALLSDFPLAREPILALT